MEYQVEQVSPVKRKINVQVPKEEVEAALSATIALYRRDVDLKGFRKGKVPASVIENRFRKQIYNEAQTDLINLHINEILNELKITPISRIDVDASELKKGEEYSYSFSFEVAPEFELPEYRGLEVEEEEVVVKEEEVEAVIERLRNRMAEFVVVEENRNPQPGDAVVIDFKAFDGEEPIEGIAASNFQLVLGEGQALEDFEKIIYGLKAGESGSGDVKLPDDFINKDLAGKTIKMEVTLHAVKEKKLPALDDGFARKVGNFKNLKELRDSIFKSYEATRKELSKSVAQKKLLDDLKSKVEFDLPPSLVEFHLEQKIKEYIDKLERQGKNLESTGKTIEDLKKEFREEAEEITKSEIFLLAVAQQEGLKVDYSEVDAELQKIATYSGQSFEAIKEFYEKNNLLVALKDKILADKAMELIYSEAKVKKVPPQDKEQEADESSTDKDKENK
ncbi:trigger factor [Desulfonauticus submarinus]|uniref:Trigger factor n=1 Tax=Desulfonauticus submarinus TaxID=206665 RepID=A0A1H0FZ27_9BACT|nr:trigger factor [Desulfonauticus submarinus]SDN99832.1 trigger factor [Desulfonauticus submarinus]